MARPANCRIPFLVLSSSVSLVPRGKKRLFAFAFVFSYRLSVSGAARVGRKKKDRKKKKREEQRGGLFFFSLFLKQFVTISITWCQYPFNIASCQEDKVMERRKIGQIRIRRGKRRKIKKESGDKRKGEKI